MFIIILTGILSILEFTFLGFVQPLINFFSQNQNLNDFVYLFNIKFLVKDFVILFILVFLLRITFAVIVSYVKHLTTKKIFDEISNKIVSNYLTNNYIFFVHNKTSKLVSNLIIEVSKFCFQYLESFIFLIIESFVILAVIVFLLMSYFKITVTFILLTLILFFIFYLKFKSLFEIMGQNRSINDEIRINVLQNIFDTIQIVKLYNQEDFLKKKFLEGTKASTSAEFNLKFISELPKNFIELVLLIFMVVSFIILKNFEYINKADLLSLMGLYVVAMFRLVPSCNRVFHALNNIKFLKPCVQIIIKELKEKGNKKIPPKIIDLNLNSSLELKNISFRFSEQDDFVLKNLSTFFKRGSITGIAGESGVGKSTFLNIICGLLLPNSGEVFLDEKKIDILNYINFQKKIGYIPQKSFLINDSILNNIILNDYNYDQSTLERAIKLAKLDDVIFKSKEGINQLIGNKGDGLSGGQQQRICFARALYKKPQLLILDEATNALDKDNVNFILSSLEKLKKELTIIIVSHDENVLKVCDEVINLKKANLN